MCEEPKLGPHIPSMRERLAMILIIDDMSRLSIKATTTEGLGFTGRGEGIAASAVCLIERNA
jgi:2-C-methyl-D-erythritol 4-phosphate cytidylyltransferase/2-C-methyl-D-erythritol 2,4-cyclodiphosphate synthase